MSDDIKILHGLLNATVVLDDLPHPGQVGRVLLGAAIAGRGCLGRHGGESRVAARRRGA